uniref:Chloramphenicol acetyltransferase-like domain-containing protein n=1 Tax=Tanacetum cinerariifolium TaxID=118510 RepID=A0A6L2M2E0_TANCI|nr:chloramphenicol acetyltransferase-like domain-containing protein [Tanacetum cinerariifolium]
MQPILGMKYDHLEQLKLTSANYRVAGGYQLWNGQVTFKLDKVKTKSNQKNFGEGTSRDGEGSSRQCETPLESGKVKEKTVSPKWTKSNISVDKQAKGKPICELRLWVSWIDSENSFQIKSLKAEHRCARNYNLGSLVTYKWIAHQFAKEIIADPFITLSKMKAVIREKFLINVSLGQCKRAKQKALFDFEGALIEHYGRDANNQMYLIAWAVVRVENNPNCSWFLSLLQEDLELGHGAGLTIISDSHNGLLDVVSDWLPNAKHRKLVHMNNKSMQLEERITPFIKKRLEILKEQQRLWTVISSGFQELEVRRGNESYGVNIHHKKCMCRLWELSAEGDLRKFSDIETWYAIEDCTQYDKKCSNPTSTIFDETIANPNAQIVGDDMVRIQVLRCMAYVNYDEHVDSLSTMDNEVGVTSHESTIQTLPLFEEYTPHVTYPEEVKKTLGTMIEPQPQPLPNCPPLDASIGTEKGLKPPIKPQSPDSFWTRVLDNLTIHTPPSYLVASFHLRDLYCYYRPCIDDPKKHYAFKPDLLGHSGSLRVDFLNLDMIDNDWRLESKEIYFLGRELNSPIWPKEVEKVWIKETHQLEHIIQQPIFQHETLLTTMVIFDDKKLALENQLLFVSPLICLGKHDCVERIPSGDQTEGTLISASRDEEDQSIGGRGAGRVGRGKEGEEGVEMVVGEQEKLAEDEIKDNREHEYMEHLLVKDEEKRTAEDKSRQDEFDQEALKLTLEEEDRFQNQDQERLREEQEFEWSQ